MGCEQDLIVRPIQKALMGCKPEHARQDDNAICSLTLMKTVGPLEAHKQSQSQNKAIPRGGHVSLINTRDLYTCAFNHSSPTPTWQT